MTSMLATYIDEIGKNGRIDLKAMIIEIMARIRRKATVKIRRIAP